VDKRLIGADARVQWRLVGMAVLCVVLAFFGCSALDSFARGSGPETFVTPASFEVVRTRTPSAPAITADVAGSNQGRSVVVSALDAVATPTHRPARYFCPVSYERGVCDDWAAVVRATPWVTFVYGE